ncbi:lipoprotein-releasing ABC transporter ATP-binding protein LolD [Alginatibacterium sediminis]|uniref:Lipoprotein-releasing system ATP-binding protein LolD n=1 Tax=Alginatibacterium sediminis TaxID=2164068 RepID=A0A420EG53_9ALTE|nr:lipoprotein-releasing ABC transporter ATP-binding protein LolD [Alginatibacterium sediminis]RKF19546.1 lipoprotein-releasing ABC transporter ATP-binding protein LolD [Alginatibacterium sediminis]
MNNCSLLEGVNLQKVYQDGDNQTQVLKGVSLELFPAQAMAIVGSSGSGKSTLLHVLGGLDSLDGGEVRFDGERIDSLNASKLAAIRNQKMGFVYQFHHLLAEFSAQENVAMPLWISGMNRSKALKQAAELLERVGLGHRLNHRPSQMSGGERQRSAIARALVNNPLLVLADEPTGNLDEDSTETIYQLLQELNSELNTSFVIVTHDLSLASKFDLVKRMTHGVLEDFTRSEIMPAAL